MPTSSQAMILRGSDGTIKSYCRPTQKPLMEDYNWGGEQSEFVYSNHTSPGRGNCEVVKFDFSVTSPEKSMDGFQGVFAFDQTTKSYRWQICSVKPKTMNDLFANSEHACGEKMSANDLLTNLQKDELNTPELSVDRQVSDYKQHFPTPIPSLLDNSIRRRTQLRGKTTLLTAIDIPPDTDLIDENEYRRLEQLGFRRRTTYMPRGALIRIKNGASPFRLPEKCLSDPETATGTMTRLSITTMSPTKLPVPKLIPLKKQGFHPKTFVSRGRDIRKRMKQKTLLQEVKECVDWENRVPNNVYRRRGKPTYIPTAVCFSVKNSYKFSHSDIKSMFETQTGSQVKALWFDPLSVRSRDPNLLDRWIITLESMRETENVIQIGFVIDGDRVTVRAWDAILKDEYIPEGEDWDVPCSFRLQADKHNYILKNFLSTH